MAQDGFGHLVKAVVDVEKEIIVVDAELHADQEAKLLEQGSKQSDLWGINLYPGQDDDFIEFDSMINIRPSDNNSSLSVEDEQVRKRIREIVHNRVET